MTGGAVLIALFAGFWLVHIGLRPLRDMETTAESIAAGNLTERVPGENDKTEVGRLARTLNVMLSRIESAFSARLASERRLRASERPAPPVRGRRLPRAAHADRRHLGLRRALRARRLGAEGGPRAPDGRHPQRDRPDGAPGRRPPAAGPAGRGPPHGDGSSVDLVALCAEAVHTALHRRAGLAGHFTATRPIEVVGDATGLRQVIDNLLGNVRAHTPAGTTTGYRWTETTTGR